MRTITFSIILLIIGVTLVSCETNKQISVIVVDKLTKQPIDSVLIEVKAGKNGDYTKNYATGYTDKKGKFEISMMIGCSFGCYDIYMEYDKNGYVHKKELNHTEGIIELEQ